MSRHHCIAHCRIRPPVLGHRQVLGLLAYVGLQSCDRVVQLSRDLDLWWVHVLAIRLIRVLFPASCWHVLASRSILGRGWTRRTPVYTGQILEAQGRTRSIGKGTCLGSVVRVCCC